jgi:outer membrane protein TolC
MIRRFAPIAALAVAGCMTAPLPSPTKASATATGAFANLPTAAIGPVPNDWWRLYDDPALDRLVQASLAANADLRVAYANLDGARDCAASARAAAANHDRERGNDRQQRDAAASSSNVPTTDYDLALTASWDIDMFGRLRSARWRRGRCRCSGRGAGLLRVAVVADTVLAYVDLCGATRAANVSREIVAVQERSVGVVRDQLAAGEVSPLEVSQAASLLESTRATLAPFEAARANALYRIATLQGRPR